MVAELLRRGEPVRVLDNLSRSRAASLDAFEGDPAYLGLVQADVTDADAVGAAADVDVVYHLAADVAVGASVREPTGAMRANVLGTLVVAEAARRRDLRLVLVSTCHVYAAADAPLDEGAAAIPASPYAASKLAAEVIAQSYARTYGLWLTTVRPFNVYGPWQRDDSEGGVVARFLSRDLASEKLEVHGDGAQTRDFVYVDDCARGIVDAAAESAVGLTLNLASGAETSITQLARLIAGDPSRVRHVPHPHPEAEVARYIGDAALAREMLGWTPRVGPGGWAGADARMVRRPCPRCGDLYVDGGHPTPRPRITLTLTLSHQGRGDRTCSPSPTGAITQRSPEWGSRPYDGIGGLASPDNARSRHALRRWQDRRPGRGYRIARRGPGSTH